MFPWRRTSMLELCALLITIISVSVAGLAIAGETSAASDEHSSSTAGLPSDPAAYRTSNSAPKKLAAQRSPKERISVGKDTTQIEQPLRAAGLPDYVAAWNERCRGNATPDQNAAVLLLNAFGPETVPAENRDPYFALLGVKPPALRGDYFIHCDEMVDRWIRGSTQILDADDEDNLRAQFIVAGEQPWSPTDFPMVAKWLSLNGTALAFIVESSGRPHFYEPLVSASHNRPALMTATLPLEQCTGEMKTALQARAMLRLKDGHLDSAWDDLLACHRLLRQMAAQSISQGGFSGHTEEIELCQAELKLLHLANPDTERIERLRAEWATLPPRASAADQINIGERYRFLDMVCLLEQQGAAAITQLFTENSFVTDDSAVALALSDARFDWNELLRLGNAWFDRLAAISRIPDRQDREAALQRAHVDLEQMVSGDRPRLFGLRLYGKRSVKMPFAALVQMCDSDFTSTFETADQNAVHVAFVQTGLALAAYRAQHGKYPRRLDELVPKFIDNVPLDLYADHAAVRYRLEENGYVLYSVGPNGLDEEAGGSDNFPDADDISVVISDSARSPNFRDSQ